MKQRSDVALCCSLTAAEKSSSIFVPRCPLGKETLSTPITSPLTEASYGAQATHLQMPDVGHRTVEPEKFCLASGRRGEYYRPQGLKVTIRGLLVLTTPLYDLPRSPIRQTMNSHRVRRRVEKSSFRDFKAHKAAGVAYVEGPSPSRRRHLDDHW